MAEKDQIQIHLFLFKELDPKKIMVRFISERMILKGFINLSRKTKG